jgi:ribonuclease P protein component
LTAVQARKFPPRARLRSPREFQAVLAGGRRFSETLLTAALRPNSLTHPRLGLAISARAVPDAVGRNRIKRQARESFRAAQDRLPSLDIVVLARSAAAGADKAALRQALERLWRRMGEH